MTDTVRDREVNREVNTETLADQAEAEGTNVAVAAPAVPTPSQSGASGGELAREVGQRDEAKAAEEEAGEGRDPTVTAVRKGDKPECGDAPNLPQRDGGGNSDSSRRGPPPRRA